MEYWALAMFLVLFLLLLIGYPVAFTLGAIALGFGTVFLGIEFFSLLPLRIWGIMTNFTLLAVPLFVFMGVILEKSGIAEELLDTMGRLFGSLRGGLAISVVVVGALLAATTGVVGASVVTMTVIALPSMLKRGYSPELASGTIAASGTLGQIIPPSIILILLGDVVGVPEGELFMAAAVPGAMLILAYILYVVWTAWRHPESAPAIKSLANQSPDLLFSVIKSLVPPLLLILAVLGSIFFGIASPTESAAVGALGAIVLAAIHRRMNLNNLREALQRTTRLTSMVFIIFIGATAFGLVFVGMGGDKLILDLFTALPGGKWTFLVVSMLLIFFLGFFLDFIEICFIVVPVIAPVAIHMGIDPLWFALLIALNLQTSFLTPPFGFSLFYLKASAPPTLKLESIYRGIVPFVAIQVIVLGLIIAFPQISLWLPEMMSK
ncbi:MULTISPECIES: TRAP transporter large permease [unclassified Methylophaga]|jgi:tripartite ATP-independent transporter DctM subunit|uniref:TRAP transporter large permease n=1 Tax=unclassified Methylophaga TaxID=2629249 RepID=UPI00259CF928|nr:MULTISPECIES: TRAP transporter large permease subunit [unclassified Methylophaga]|tara:strand:- start:38525 stop:39832 length:1308 start_codon:yes stop_codon:yes gene_type:complete